MANGEAIFSPPITRRLTGYFAAPHGGAAAAQPFPELTERERDILVLIASGGYTNTAVADRLYLSRKTVRSYVSRIFAKLGVADRAGTIVRAREAGFGRQNL